MWDGGRLDILERLHRTLLKRMFIPCSCCTGKFCHVTPVDVPRSLWSGSQPSRHAVKPKHPTPSRPIATASTLHPAPYTLLPTPYTLDLTPFTIHPSPYTLHPTLYTSTLLTFTASHHRSKPPSFPAASPLHFRFFPPGNRPRFLASSPPERPPPLPPMVAYLGGGG